MRTWKDFERDILIFVVLGFLFFSFLLIVLYIVPLATEDSGSIGYFYKFSNFEEENKEDISFNETTNRTV